MYNLLLSKIFTLYLTFTLATDLGLSDLLQKPPKTLVMNRVDGYRKIQEERYLIDRTIPLVDYGKGCKWNSLPIDGAVDGVQM
jgi:hypothetical protein